MRCVTPFDREDHEVIEMPSRSHRAQRMLTVKMRNARIGTLPVVVRNVSHGGAGCMTKQWLAMGEAVEIELPNFGWVPGTVAWTDASRFGIRFDDEIDSGRVTRDVAPGMDTSFRVMDRFRPEPSIKRPPIGLR